MAYTGGDKSEKGEVREGGGELSCLAGQAVVRRNYATTGRETKAQLEPQSL